MEIYLSLPNWVDEYILENVVRPNNIPFEVYHTVPIIEPIDAREIRQIDRVTHEINGYVTTATALEMEKNYQMIDRANRIIIFYSTVPRLDVRINDLMQYCNSIHKPFELYSTVAAPAVISLKQSDRIAFFGPKFNFIDDNLDTYTLIL
jgi:hypothetical protein